ncbi:probable peptidase [Aeropyrum pernix K1]|uniref:Probable peptidase n=1 Tax=Aeropyrum pernix (strain ATCC 700893 / DSM 11879 / JCM 9820 / NBRC 100138 / K1) TaxID=272557 RepID=Q9YG12_AERPE|nr:TldD/PmbA family protein [Aeropyrum pernix]BAA78998.2 probable peptidase [Aeropyrum pernix K1]
MKSGENSRYDFYPPDPVLLEKLVEKALDKGASYAEARFHARLGDSVLVVNDRVVGGGFEIEEGVAFRVIVDGALGFASTSLLSEESLDSVVDHAVSIARSSSRGFRKKVGMSEERLGQAQYSLKVKKDFRNLELEDKASIVLEYSKSLESKSVDLKAKTFSYSDVLEAKLIITSDGGNIESIIPRVSIFYNIAAEHGDRRANKWGHLAGSGGLELVGELGLESMLKDDVNSLEVNLVKAEPSPKGVMDVIISPEIVGLALHESIGHPSEADRVMGREAAQAGLSYRMWLDGRIGSSKVTVADDPTVPGSYGFYLYDDEAVPARERILINKGELAELLHSRTTAYSFGVQSNGAARAMNYRSEPIVRMSNTYLKPGDMRFEELLEDVKEGIYMKSYMEWNIDEFRLVARYVGLEAYLIKNGRIVKPVRDTVLEIPTESFYSKIDGVGKDLRFYAGICGKGEPPQPLPVWMGGPHVRVRDVRVG